MCDSPVVNFGSLKNLEGGCPQPRQVLLNAVSEKICQNQISGKALRGENRGLAIGV